MRILVVEDNIDIASILEKILVKEGYVVDIANNIKLATQAVLGISYDLIILDRMLPDGEGLDLIKYCKEKKLDNRYLILSALNEIAQRVEGLDAGANDYIAKPFEPEELRARVRVSLRQPLPERKEKITLGNISYDSHTHDTLLGNEPIVLPRREKLVLELLIKRFNRVVSREVLEQNVYGYDDDISSNSLESHVSKLRKNLAKVKSGLIIHTVRGIGYILKEEQ
jgi:DNA-binding response OmpR family regulator